MFFHTFVAKTQFIFYNQFNKFNQSTFIMKRFTRFISLGLCMIVGLMSSAQTFQHEGITYNVIGTNEVAVAKSMGDPYSGSIDIPNAVPYNGRDYSVTKIASYAFAEDAEHGPNLIESVTMKNNIKAIEEAAFQGCTKLRSAKISDRTIYLGVNAFAYCFSLTSVTLGSELEEIRDGAFFQCERLGQISLPNGLIKIGKNAFAYSSTLTSITFPNAVESIGNSAFANCDNLSSVTFGTGIETIGDGCFQNCVALPTITLPTKLTVISPSTFAGCSKLSSIKFGPEVTIISDKAFDGCKALQALEIPATVKEIGENTFDNCDGINNLTFADNATDLRYGSDNFRTSPIERLNLGRTLIYTSNNSGAFSEASRTKCSLKRVEISSTVRSLPKAIFKGCKALSTLNIAEGLGEIGSSAFEGCEGIISVKLPETVSRILDNAFAKCYYMTAVNIPSAVTVIELQSFFECRYITSVDLSNVTTIKMAAFSECDRLADVKLSSKLQFIENDAFNTCLALRSITIPENVKSIGSGAFYKSALVEISSLAAVPPTAYDDTWTKDIYANASLTVPSKSYDAYKGATGWKNFSNFKQVKIFTVSVNANEGGSVLLNGTETNSLELKENESLTITLRPNYDKIVESASYKMGSITKSFSTSESINPVTSDVTIDVTFADKPATPPTSIAISANPAYIKPDQTSTIDVKYTPADAYSPVTFDIASGAQYISLNGNTVTGLANGTATVRATTATGLTATCTVTVDDGSVSIADFEPGNLALYEPYQCRLTGAATEGVKWSSSDEKIVKFFDNGVMMIVAGGHEMAELTISATLPSGQVINKELFFWTPQDLYEFNYKGYHYAANGPWTLSFDYRYVDFISDVEVPATFSFDDFNFTVNEVLVYSINGSGFHSLTIPASIENISIESNYIDRITSHATVPPTGTLSLWKDENPTIYVPEASVDAYQSKRPWSSYKIMAIGTVETTYNVTVKANAGGAVLLNGTETNSITVKEGERLDISVEPNYGKVVKSASYTMGSTTRSFTDYTTIGSVTADVTVNVIFDDENQNPDVPGDDYVAENATFDFTVPSALNPAQTANSSNSPVCEVPDVKFTNKNISLMATGGSTTPRIWAYRDSYQFRVYNNAIIYVSIAESSSVITGVTVTGSQLDALQINGMTLSDDTSVKVDFPTNVTQFSLDCKTNGNHKRADITSITVHYLTTSGIEDVIANDNSDVTVYNLQGIVVSNSTEGLEPGIYIVRRGDKISKIVIR